MNSGERAVLRKAFADFLRAVDEMNQAAWEDARTRIADKLDIPQRNGTYDFAQYETPRNTTSKSKQFDNLRRRRS